MEKQFEQLEKMVSEYEKSISHRSGGDIEERACHVLRQFRTIADNCIFDCQRFLSDVKTHFKALELIVEGITDEGLNHGQKRVIANHVIRMLRSAIDKIDQNNLSFNDSIFDRFNWFRSETPERRLYEERKELSRRVKNQDELIKKISEKHPELVKEIENEIPF